MTIPFFSLVVGVVATVNSPVAARSVPNPNKCFSNDTAKVRVCCAGTLPTLLEPTILWNMAPEMCDDTSCTKKQSHEVYLGNGHHVFDILTPKSNFSSKSERDDLINTFLQANASGMAMSWTGPSLDWTGSNGTYTFGICRLRSTKTSAWIEFSRRLDQTI